MFTFTISQAGLPGVDESQTAAASTGPVIDGHVDPRQIMDVGVMNSNVPRLQLRSTKTTSCFLTLTNVGMIMRPDLFEQHTIHFHGYPNASSVYDGVPDASVAINIGGSFTYYYLTPDAGTYFWHCHITPPEHLRMRHGGPAVRAAAAKPSSDEHVALQCARAAKRPDAGIIATTTLHRRRSIDG